MKYAWWLTLSIIAVGLWGIFFGNSLVSAAVTTPPVPIDTPKAMTASPVIISAYQIIGSSLEFVQLYNASDELVSLEGGALTYGYASESPAAREAVVLSGLMRPRTHLVVSVDGLLEQAALPTHFSSTATSFPASIATIAFSLPGFQPATVPSILKTNGVIQQRSKTTTGYSTVTFGDFNGDLYADTLYEAPSAPPLEIIEVSPRAKECEPYALDPMCGDFIKLKILPGYNAQTNSNYRVRTDDGSESVTNTFSLEFASQHDGYLLVRLRDDGHRISLANAGGYVWLEDTYGEVYYDTTLQTYPDAGDKAYVDRSWALDETDGIWKWAIPSPTGANHFPPVVNIMDDVLVNEQSDCPAGKYRNPETNRCRAIEEVVSTLTMCEEGKERNPLTNRCRSVTTATSSSVLTPCEEGQERNPVTNRCRSVLAASTTLTPCQIGYERNPETNRCRKVINSPLSQLATPAAAALEAGGGSSLKNALIITVGLGAVGYGVYEWRRELWRLLRRLTTFLTSK